MFKRLSKKTKKDKTQRESGGDATGAAVPYLEPETGEAVTLPSASPPPGPGPGVGKPKSPTKKKLSTSSEPYSPKGPSDFGSQGYQIGEAAEKGQLEKLRQLLKGETIDVNASDKSGMTALHRSAVKGHAAVVRQLLLHSADVEAKNKTGETSLYLALHNGHIGTVGVLLDYMHSVDNRHREPFLLLRAHKKKEKTFSLEKVGNASSVKSFQKRDFDMVQVVIGHGQKADDMAAFLGMLDVPAIHSFFINIVGNLSMKNFQHADIKAQASSLTVLNTTVKRLEVIGYVQLKSVILVSCELSRLTLDGLPNLELLDVRYNRLDALPVTLRNCRSLKTLKCAHNHIRRLPSELGESPLKDALMAIDCSYNNIKRLPTTVVNCRELRYLQCDHNGLVELPVDIGLLANIEELIVNNNKLSHLPLSVSSLKTLKKLAFHTNPLQNIPGDFPERASEVRRYLMALQDDPVPNTMVKLVLVGQEGVGKTTLLKALKRTFWLLPRSPSTPKTDGIDVKDIQLDDLTLRCFDCGGDVDFNETHNFFITQGALYLACFNLAEYCLSTVERSSFLLGRLQLWLQYIFSKVPSAQVLIVGTHADHASMSKQVLEEVWEHLRQLMVRGRDHHHRYFSKSERVKDCLLCQSDTKCLRRVSGVGNAGFVNLGFDDATSIDSSSSGADGPMSEMSFPHIVGYYEISSVKAMGNDKFFQPNVNKSMEHLKDAMREVAKRLIQRNPEIPRRWACVQESLQNHITNYPEHSVLTIDEVASLAKVQRVVDKKELVNMLQFFKAQGLVLYFPQLDNLENTVVLDPEWLAKIFASVVSYRDTGISTEGFIDRDQLKDTWTHLDTGMKDRILTLLRHFGLCLPVRETNMELFPSKLPLGEPDEVSWPTSPQRGERQVTYSVTFPSIIPPPFFSNLMVTVFRYRVSTEDLPLTPRYFSNQILDWLKLERAGCRTCGQSPAGPQMAEQYLIHRVLFQMVPHRRTVQFTVRGATPCCMVKIVGRILNKVMRHFEGLGAIELDTIVCPGCVMQEHEAPHKFSANYLANEHKPKEKVFCGNGHVLADSAAILCGVVNESCMPNATIRPKSSRDKYDYSGCPKLFIFLPVNKDGMSFERELQLCVSSVLCDGYAAHLLCEFPDGYHLTKTPGYRVKAPKEFMQSHGGHVVAVLRLLRHVAESTVSAQYAKQNKAISHMVVDILKDLLTKYPFVKDTTAALTAEQLHKQVQERGNRLKRDELRRHFHIMDKPDAFGPLRRLVYGEQTLWLCSEHYRQMRILKFGTNNNQEDITIDSIA